MSANLDELARLTGDAAMDAWLAVPGDWVEEPNERRGGLSGVKRILSSDGRQLYRKQQFGHLFRSWQHPFGYPTSMRERDALVHCQRLGVPVPRLIFAGCRKHSGDWQAVLVTEGLEGFRSLEECYLLEQERAWGETLHLQLLQEVGRVLGHLNSGKRQHGCLYLKHVFVRVRGEAVDVALIDLEKSRKRLTRWRAARHDLRQIARRSPWTASQWQAFLDGYRASYGADAPAPVRG